MLISAVLKIRPMRTIEIPATTGNTLHAFFLDQVRLMDSRLAARLHAPGEIKPFTVSSLQGSFESRGGKVRLSEKSEYWFRITGLEAELSHVLLDLTKMLPATVSLFGSEFDLIGAAVEDREHSWSGRSSCERIYAESMERAGGSERKIRLKFFSPTTFRSGEVNIPFPLPSLIFESVAAKWNRFAPPSLRAVIGPEINQILLLSGYELATRMMDFGRYRQAGFIGNSDFLIRDGVDDSIRRTIRAMVDFLFYSGVGYKTTMGMGQVKKT